MSILNYRPEELTTQRKITSDAKNNTDELTFPNTVKAKSKYSKISRKRDDLELEALIENGDRAYFESLECS